MKPQPAVGGSFRDPTGFVFRRDGKLYRQVQPAYREHYDHLMSSGLYDKLVTSHLLIPHEEVDLNLAASPGAWKILAPEMVELVSYPYEWCFSQLRDAALTTLRIQRIAMEHGMSLKDASAYNIQFHRGRPVLIDTLSFEKLPEGRPWLAYRQFCQHFLAPLALMAYRDVRLGQLSRVHLDGVPIDLAAELLPGATKLRPSLKLHIHSHAKSQLRAASGDQRPRRGTFSLRAFQGLIESLDSAVRRLQWDAPTSAGWAGYYAEADHYSPEASEHKAGAVAALVEKVGPRSVWDLGANTGRFSRIASDRGIFTGSFDIDPACVEASYRTVVERKETSILPLVMDLTNPSPGIGWDNRERLTLSERGPVDLVVALALIHHLAISNNVPLPRVADFFAGLAGWLVIEMVPREDEKVKQLLSSRDDIFDQYTEQGFEDAFSSRFAIESRERLPGSSRTLYLMRRTS